MGFLKDLIPHSFTEVVLFIILCIIIIIFINLFHFTMVQKKVKANSRCYKSTVLSSTRANEYSIIGYTLKENIEILRVSYDFKKKESVIEITAPAGTVVNKVELKLYNLKTYEAETIEKTFNSTMNFNLLDNAMIFTGNHELVRFMQYGNTDFFEKILFAVAT